MRTHYPRTPHLPWSPGATPDDVRAGGLSGLRGHDVVVTEKLDGENTTLYTDGLHARSLDSAHHPSRAWVKALQGRIGRRIPAGWRVCGENVHARHSLAYHDLESWFYAFSVWDGDRCLDWDSTVRFARHLGVPLPPVLWRGTFDERALRALRLDTARQEGYVVRTAEGFGRAEFGGRVAKWVRRGHVTTDTHWTHAAVVPNGLGGNAALWEERSGAAPGTGALLNACGLTDDDLGGAGGVERARAAVAEVRSRLDQLDRSGETRLAGVLAALTHGAGRGVRAGRLAGRLGMPLARRVTDLVALHTGPHHSYPDAERRAGLARMAVAVDLGVLHAVAAAVLAGREDAEAAGAREQVDWSALHAEDAGLLGPAPLAALRAGLRAWLGDLDDDAADRCWAGARESYALGRASTAREAVAASWRWRSGAFPRLVQLVGPSGSGKSAFAAGLPGVDTLISLDDLREARGARSDQRANPDVLRAGLARLDEALAGGGTVVWDATCLNPRQRSLVHRVARRRDALLTHAVLLVDDGLCARRNAARPHPVPADVLAAQLGRFSPPTAAEAHRTWYVGADGTVGDTAGTLRGGGADEEWQGPDGMNAGMDAGSDDGEA